jgi:hypothetical protein
MLPFPRAVQYLVYSADGWQFAYDQDTAQAYYNSKASAYPQGPVGLYVRDQNGFTLVPSVGTLPESLPFDAVPML